MGLKVFAKLEPEKITIYRTKPVQAWIFYRLKNTCFCWLRGIFREVFFFCKKKILKSVLIKTKKDLMKLCKFVR